MPINPKVLMKINEKIIIQNVEIKFAIREKYGFTELEKFVTHQNIDKNKDVKGKQ